MTGVWGRRWWLIALAVLAALVGLYAAAGFLLVPRWTRSELVGITARDYGRTLSLGDVSFNPFTWTLEIADFSFPDADGRPMISFGRLTVAVGIASVSRLAPSLSEIVLDSPHVNAVVRRDGKLNLADLEKPFAQQTQPKAQAQSSRPFKLFLDRLAVANGSATYEDDSRPTPFRLDLNPIAFELLDFSTTGNTGGNYHLTATIGQGGLLDWTGTIRAQPISLRGALKLDALSARTVGTYLGPILPAEISRGTIALQGSFAIDSAPKGATQSVTMTIDVPQARVSGLGIRPRRAAADYVRLDRFTLGNAHIDLGRRSIRIGQIVLAGAEVHGWLDQGGQLNLLQLVGASPGKAPAHTAATATLAPAPTAAPAPAPQATPASAPTAAPAPSPPSAPRRAAVWHIAAPDIRLENTRVSLEDRGIKPAAELMLGPLSAHITGYDSLPDARITVSLQSAVNGKGRMTLTGEGTLQPEGLSAKLELTRVDLRALQPYFNRYTALTLASGFLSTTLDVGRRADGQTRIAGRVDIADLRTVDDDLKQDFVKWQDLHIVGVRYVSSPASLQVKYVAVVAPYARVIIGADHTFNVSEALHPRGYHPTPSAGKTGTASTAASGTSQAGAVAGGASPSTSASMSMAIGVVRVANGTADYADFSMEPNFVTGIQDLHGTIKGLSSHPSSRATVDLQGRVDRYAPVDISGVVNLLAASTYTDLKMDFRGLQLTRMTPYAVRFAGYKIASGTLDANLHYKVDHSRLNADHTLVINQLVLGEQVPSPHATKLPLRLAIALLKDRNGVIHLGLPVTGSLNDPQFSLGPLIGKALLAVLKKAVTAPFAILGRLAGGGADINRIEFPPGSATLLPAAQTQVAALAKALAQRPQLQLQVPAVYAADLDKPALARRQLDQELITLARNGAGRRGGHGNGTRGQKQSPPSAAGREVLELPGMHYRLLLAAYQNAFGPKAPLPDPARKVPPYDPAVLALQSALLRHIQVSDADLQALAQRRAQAIRSAILSAGGVAATRVGIVAAAPEPASEGKVTVKLGLK